MIEHDIRYYDEAKPTISDYEYDQKLKQLIAYEKEHPDQVDPNSPTLRVAESPTKGFIQREHLVPMYSLANTYSEKEVEDFIQRVHKLLEKKEIEFCCELKMDGTAISLLYEKGKLVSATTRGNGKKGDDVTANIKTIKTVPLKLSGKDFPDVLEMRGEVYLSLTSFRAINHTREEEGLDLFANPRNAAAGSLKLLDPHEVVKRKLNLVAYGIAEGMAPVDTQEEVHHYLKKIGMPIASSKHLTVAKNLSEIMKFAEKIQKERADLPFEIDANVYFSDKIIHIHLILPVY